MELVLLHSTVNIVRAMQQATTMLLVAAAFNIFVESSTNRKQHVAVLPQWNTAFTDTSWALRYMGVGDVRLTFGRFRLFFYEYRPQNMFI